MKTKLSAFKAYQELIKLMKKQEQEMYIQGQVDLLVDIAMNEIREKYFKHRKWDAQDKIEHHINFCLTELSHSFNDIEYEIWCMMACIVGIKK